MRAGFVRSIGWKLLLIALALGLEHGWTAVAPWFLGPETGTAIVAQAGEALAWLLAGIIAIQVFNLLAWDTLAARALGKTPPRLLIQLTSFLLLLLVVSGIVYWVFGYPVTALWAASGALGIVVGLALRNLILDTFSGLALHLEQPFRTGEVINVHSRIGTFIGQVEEINWRTTRLRGTENNTIIVPNSAITGTIITNYSRPDTTSELELPVVLDFAVPPDRAVRLIQAAVRETVLAGHFLPQPAPKVQIAKLTENGVQYTTATHLDVARVSIGKARNTYYTNLLKHLAAAGLTVAYPKRDVFTATMPWRHKTWNHQGDAVRLLSRIPLFERLSDEELKILVGGMNLTPLMEGETVVTQGDAGSSMFVLAEGILEVFVPGAGGGEIKVATLTPGLFFGEKSLLTGEPRSATIRALTAGLVAEIPKDAMLSLMDSNDAIIGILSRALAERDLNTQQALAGADQSTADLLEDATQGFMNKIRRFFGRQLVT